VANFHVFESFEVLSDAVAMAIVSLAVDAVGYGRGFRLGLLGGRTPAAAYRILGSGHAHPVVDWSRVSILFADERVAPPTEPESNYWEVRKLLLEPAGVPPANVHRMKADEQDLEAAARDYDARLIEALDLLVLGVGEDGHTASLFPGSPTVKERVRRVLAVFDSPKPSPRRLTIAPRVIAEARQVLVLASGSGKAQAVAEALKEGDALQVPARLARERLWYLDEAAAAKLDRSH